MIFKYHSSRTFAWTWYLFCTSQMMISYNDPQSQENVWMGIQILIKKYTNIEINLWNSFAINYLYEYGGNSWIRLIIEGYILQPTISMNLFQILRKVFTNQTIHALHHHNIYQVTTMGLFPQFCKWVKKWSFFYISLLWKHYKSACLLKYYFHICFCSRKYTHHIKNGT